jgi:hypothetical protein
MLNKYWMYYLKIVIFLWLDKKLIETIKSIIFVWKQGLLGDWMYYDIDICTYICYWMEYRN